MQMVAVCWSQHALGERKEEGVNACSMEVHNASHATLNATRVLLQIANPERRVPTAM
jgi:hypothetical protein